MEHVKIHFKITEPGADLLNRLQQDLDEDDAGLACDICEPIYQQLFFRQKDAYKLCHHAIRLQQLTGDNCYFERAMGYLDLAIHTAETLMHGMLNRSGEPIVVSHQSQQLSLPYCSLNKWVGWLDWSNYLCQAIARRAYSSVELLM